MRAPATRRPLSVALACLVILAWLSAVGVIEAAPIIVPGAGAA